MRRRWWLWGTLVFVALAPFVLVMCSPAPPPAAPAAPAAASIEPSPAAIASAPATVESASAPATPASPAPPDPAPLPPYRGAVPQSCAELERAMRASFNDLACTTDGDCTTASFHCACASVMARRAKPKYEALSAVYEKKDCFNRGPPRPCATCRPPPTPVCNAGKCFGQYP